LPTKAIFFPGILGLFLIPFRAFLHGLEMDKIPACWCGSPFFFPILILYSLSPPLDHFHSRLARNVGGYGGFFHRYTVRFFFVDGNPFLLPRFSRVQKSFIFLVFSSNLNLHPSFPLWTFPLRPSSVTNSSGNQQECSRIYMTCTFLIVPPPPLFTYRPTRCSSTSFLSGSPAPESNRIKSLPLTTPHFNSFPGFVLDSKMFQTCHTFSCGLERWPC